MHMINDYVCSVLDRPMPDNRGKRCYTQLPRFLDQRKVYGLSHIIFVAYYPDPHLLKKVLTLRSTGKVYTSLLAGCIREDVKIENYFDQYYEYSSFRELHEIVGKSEPHSWHVAIQPLYNAAIVIDASLSNSRFVLDIADAYFFITNDTNGPLLKLEQAILSQTDYIIHKMPKEAWVVLRDAYNLNCSSSGIMPYPYHEFIIEPQLRSVNSPPHVVYAAGMIPHEIAVSRGHENHIIDDLITLTGEENYELTIYVYQNAREMPWYKYQNYFDLENRCRFFHFRKGLPCYAITEELPQYDAGIFFDNISMSSYNMEHFKYNIASKFFTYLEGGLPIVIFEEAEFMADLVRDYKLGSIYKARQPQTIVEAIKEASRNDYRKNITSFCKKFSMEKNIPLLLEAHNL